MVTTWQAAAAAPLVRADVGSFPSGHVITTVVVGGLALVAALSRPGQRKLPLIGSGIALVLWWFFTPLLARDRGKPLIRR